MAKGVNIIGWVLYGLVVVLLLLTMWMVLQKLLGHSPTEITILLWMSGVLVSLQVLVLTILFQMKGDLGELKEFKRQTIEKVKNLEIKVKF